MKQFVALFSFSLLTACATAPAPKSPADTLAYAQGALATAEETLAQGLTQGKVSAADGVKDLQIGDQIRNALTAARQALQTGGDPTASLNLALSLLTQLQSALQGVKP